jgi:ATP-dependent DNA ligase
MLQPCPLHPAVTAMSVPASGDWLHEPKMDGYRLQALQERERRA